MRKKKLKPQCRWELREKKTNKIKSKQLIGNVIVCTLEVKIKPKKKRQRVEYKKAKVEKTEASNDH